MSKVKAPLHIRFTDLDAMGHVNNAIFFTYFEEGRVVYFDHIQWDWKNDPLIVARNEINYKRPLHYHDKPVIHLGCSKIGHSSFDMEYQLYNKDGALVAEGRSVLVAYDYTTGAPVALSATARAKLI